MEHKIKHLEMVQSVINRMANNSFLLKGWAVTMVSGIFVLANKDTDKMYFLVAYIPILMFWCLDAYYLLQERLYRTLFSEIQESQTDEASFSMEAPLEKYKNDKNNYCDCWCSKTEMGFYLPLAFVCAGIIVLSYL